MKQPLNPPEPSSVPVVPLSICPGGGSRGKQGGGGGMGGKGPGGGGPGERGPTRARGGTGGEGSGEGELNGCIMHRVHTFHPFRHLYILCLLPEVGRTVAMDSS
jgi:hypothetical protein